MQPSRHCTLQGLRATTHGHPLFGRRSEHLPHFEQLQHGIGSCSTLAFRRRRLFPDWSSFPLPRLRAPLLLLMLMLGGMVTSTLLSRRLCTDSSSGFRKLRILAIFIHYTTVQMQQQCCCCFESSGNDLTMVVGPVPGETGI